MTPMNLTEKVLTEISEPPKFLKNSLFLSGQDGTNLDHGQEFLISETVLLKIIYYSPIMEVLETPYSEFSKKVEWTTLKKLTSLNNKPGTTIPSSHSKMEKLLYTSMESKLEYTLDLSTNPPLM